MTKSKKSPLASSVAKVFKVQLPENTLSSESKMVLESIANHIMEEIAKLTLSVCVPKKKATIQARDIHFGAKSFFKGTEIGIDAMEEGKKAAGMNKDDGGKKKSRTSESRTKRVGLDISIPRVENALRLHFLGKRVSPDSAAYLAAVVDTVLSTLILHAGAAAKDVLKKTRITNHHLQHAFTILEDIGFKKVFPKIIIPNGGKSFSEEKEIKELYKIK